LQTTQYLDSLLSDLLQSELKMQLLEVEGGHMPQCPIAGDATARSRNEATRLMKRCELYVAESDNVTYGQAS